ncbi:MAG: SDR family NAD(P)-dependent oxidoreductase [Betaproteobacteria bacterium]|nr:SDR family NAD(P)-dependent oxidoreductase [Betaproteobacteria bacterium]
MSKTALIVGAGSGLSAALARVLAADGYGVTLAARNIDKLAALCKEIKAAAIRCDVGQRAEVDRLFEQLDGGPGTPNVVIYNPSARVRGPLIELDPAKVAETLTITALGGFLVGQAAARRMLKEKAGTILFTGASASVKGYAQSAAFAMGKFALRGLAQSMARELQPQGIHVAHVVIDGGIRSAARPVPADNPDSLLAPEAIAQSYMHLIRQARSAWSWEIEVRPWVERF